MILNLLILIFLAGIAILTVMLITSLKARNKILKGIRGNPFYMIKGPLVSAIIPTLDEEDYLPKCLKSLKNQTYQNIEIIVVDNFSKDRTVEIAKNFGAKIIKVSERNLSLVRNEGAKRAKGKILLFVDADCILSQNYVEKIIKELSKKVVLSHGGVCTYDSLFHGFLRVFSRWLRPYFYTSGSGICLWQKAFWGLGGFDQNLDPFKGEREDLDLGKRILKKFGLFSIKYSPTVLIGTSARREKIFGYPIFKFPSAWTEGARGVRKGKIIY